MSSVNGVILSKRARELQQSESTFPLPSSTIEPSSPSLSTVHESQLNSNISRRPRAGTLPSTFHIGTSAAIPNNLNRGSNSGFIAPGSNAGGVTLSLPGSGTNSPSNLFSSPNSNSNNSNSINSLPLPTSSNLNSNSTSRLRSGSLGLPSSGLSNAFGPTVWSGGWGSTNNSTNTNNNEIGSNGNGLMIPGDDGKSPGSSTYGDDSHVRTLDYLGLEGDSPIGTSSGNNFGLFNNNNSNPIVHNSSSFSNLRSVSDVINQQQQQGRIRSNTVATFPLSSYSTNNNRSPFPSTVNNEEYFNNHELPQTSSSTTSYHRSNDSTDSNRLLYSSVTTVAPGEESDLPHRARAATVGVGMTDERETYLRRRAGTTAGGINSNNGVEDYSGGSASVLNRRLRGMSISQDDSSVNWNNSRPITPDHLPSLSSSPSPTQLPTRSLWIGNLDPSTTTSELHAVFSPYGPIENLRLIPDKECGFVNFYSTSDAMHAKEDVLNRLGGQVPGSNSTVRIGYGKPEPSSPSTSMGVNMMNRTSSGLANNNNESYSPELSMQTTNPTRALWIGSIPNTTTPADLVILFSPFGQIESARVLSHKSCGFINFERQEDAISARNTLSGRNILGAEIGTVRIGYAKVPNKSSNFSPDQYGLPLPVVYNQNRSFVPANLPLDDGSSFRNVGGVMPNNLATSGSSSHIAGSSIDLNGTVVINAYEGDSTEANLSTIIGSEKEVKEALVELCGDNLDNIDTVGLAPRTDMIYYDSFPPNAYNDPVLARRYANADAPRLRELRKQLDGLLTTEEIDQIAFDLADECVALASDYIGNTLIQKIFERASPQGRMILLVRIAPHMAQIGIHKNGTWAVQKIIQTVQTQEEHDIVQKSLQPFTPALLLNDFGNYVVQGALRFGSPITDFIFDSMVDRCWEIGSGRFGARSTRQTLESPLASPHQIKRVAAAILLNSIPLATNPNGTLLITWLLDSSNLPGRYRALATRYLPHLSNLCTHKLASLAILKIVNQRIDPAAARIILDALSDEDSKLIEEILADQIHGATFITKILNSAFVDLKERATMTERIRSALGLLQAQTIPAYRSLVEFVGMPYQGVIVPQQPMPSSNINNERGGGPFQQQQQQRQFGNNSGPQWQQQQQFLPYPQQQQQFQPMGYAPYPQQQFNQPLNNNNYPNFYPSQPFFGGNGQNMNNFQGRNQQQFGGNQRSMEPNFNNNNNNNHNHNNNNFPQFPSIVPPAPQLDENRLQDFPKLVPTSTSS